MNSGQLRSRGCRLLATPHDVGVLECPFLRAEVLVPGREATGVADTMIEISLKAEKLT
jgi:hypothetical protein